MQFVNHNGVKKTKNKQPKKTNTMSNLHKDLLNDQIHNPKDFDTAAVSTKLTKNASGNLEWIADSGGGGGVTQIVAGTDITISPVGGTGVVTVNTSFVEKFAYHQFVKCYGTATVMTKDQEYSMAASNGNNEHRFNESNGVAPATTITPQNSVRGAIMVVPVDGIKGKIWNGWVYGNSGLGVTLRLYRMRPVCEGVAEALPPCLMATETFALLGNTSPICFSTTSFELECPLLEGDLMVLTATMTTSTETNTFNVSTSLTLAG